MGVSGHALDSQFATGVLDVLSEHLEIVHSSSGHWRPKADLGKPYGKITGDLCCCFTQPGQEGYSLLIIEREGSGPGNERNILKWYRAVQQRVVVSIDDGRQRIEVRPARVLLAMAFMRPPGWDQSDFEKTAAFSELLGDLLNMHAAFSEPTFSVVVERYAQQLECCESCGRDMAISILKRLGTTGVPQPKN